MRTNYSGFALAVCMGLLVVTIGLLALSVGGLVRLGPATETTDVPTMQGDEGPDYPGKHGPVVQPAYMPGNPQEAAAIAAGEALFKNNCAQCHAVNDKVVGPALAGVTKRRSIGWLISWVHNSSKVIASGDEYAVKLFDDNGKQQMPAFPQLADKDIRAIIAYVSAQEAQSVIVDIAPAPGQQVAAR